MKIKITKEQEDRLLTIIIKANKNPHTSEDEKKAEEAYLKLFELMHPLIYAVAKLYLKSGIDDKELIGLAKKGFRKAVLKWTDHYKDNPPKWRFSTYSTWYIRAEIHKKLGLPLK